MKVYRVDIRATSVSVGSTGSPQTRGTQYVSDRAYFVEANCASDAALVAELQKRGDENWIDVLGVELIEPIERCYVIQSDYAKQLLARKQLQTA